MQIIIISRLAIVV